jgi:hypothetical protein
MSLPSAGQQHDASMARKKLMFTPLAAESPLSKPLAVGGQTMPVLSLGLRSGVQDTRPLAARHVVDLAESISILGLLEPIVVEPDGNLLAGAHRRAAVQLLAIADPAKRRALFVSQVFRSGDAEAPGAGGRLDEGAEPPDTGEIAGLAERIEAIRSDAFLAQCGSPPKIPVQVMEIPRADRTAQVLAIEAAENNVRRPYTHEEIVQLALRLKKAGYRIKAGKPKRGERSMLSALEAAVGRSKRQIQNILSEDKQAPASDWDKAEAALRRAAQRILDAGERRTGARSTAIVSASRRVLAVMRRHA